MHSNASSLRLGSALRNGATVMLTLKASGRANRMVCKEVSVLLGTSEFSAHASYYDVRNRRPAFAPVFLPQESSEGGSFLCEM